MEKHDKVGDAVCRSICEDIAADAFLTKNHIKKILVACERALGKSRPTPAEVEPTVRKGKRVAATGPDGVRLEANNMTQLWVDLGWHERGGPTNELKRFRGIVNTNGSGEYNNYLFEVIE